MGNKGAGGPFAPLVVVVRGVMGEKEFNKFRGKAISLHSQGVHSSHTTSSRQDTLCHQQQQPA